MRNLKLRIDPDTKDLIRLYTLINFMFTYLFEDKSPACKRRARIVLI